VNHKETDTFCRDWQVFRTQLLKYCLRSESTNKFLKKFCEHPENVNKNVERFLSHLAIGLNKKIQQSHQHFWDDSLILLANQHLLAEGLKQDSETLCSGKNSKNEPIDSLQAFGQLFRRFLDRSRQEVFASEQGVTSHKVKTADRLHRISNKLASESNAVPYSRCSISHVKKLVGYIKENYPQDQNLPRTEKTIEEYFSSFCFRCHEITEAFDNPDENERYIAQSQMKNLAGDEDLNKTHFEQCLLSLEPEDRDILDVAYKLRLSEMTYLNVKAYQQAKQLKPAEYKKRLASAMKSFKTRLETIAAEEL
jgi:anthranilate/para-aminobenzoate synthase component I